MLLAKRRAIEAERMSRNVAAAEAWKHDKCGWVSVDDGDGYRHLWQHRLAVDEFESPDDRWGLPLPEAKDYSDASEGTGQVKVCGSNYDVEEIETFEPLGEHKLKDIRGNWGRGDTLGFDDDLDLSGKMTGALKAWAGMTTPPPKAADPTVETLVESYMAAGGTVHTCGTYRTTPKAKIKFKSKSPHASSWAGGSGIPREMRRTNKLFSVRPRTSSKPWSLAA
jgi:hypothetical protein